MSSVIKVDQIQLADGSTPTAADLGLNTSGSILQVVQTVVSAQQATTSTSWIDATGLSLNITPSSVNNKILVIASLETGGGASGTNNTTRYRVVRDGTTVMGMQSLRTYDYGSSGVYITSSTVITNLDSPNTVSQITYKVQLIFVAGSNAYINSENGTSTLTVMEIAG